ncbi:MAG: DNA-binding protein [Phenylobacterium sp.]|nr:MAG: DNA-binding protein [Phenylobacterium sp.]
MSEDIYTVEQFAERLKLHPKTVLRFIREGRLRAVKVGRSYRILRSDMEAFGIAPPRSGAARVRVTAIVDVPDISPERAQHLARVITSARLGGEARADPMHIDVAHDPAMRQVKVVLVGAPGDVAAMLRMIDVFLEQVP